MNYLYRLADKNKQDRDDFVRGFIALLAFALLSMTAIIALTVNISELSGMPIPVSGRLQDVEYGYQQSFDLHIDGEIYILRKPNKYSNRSFGLLNDMTLREIRGFLEQNINTGDIELEYVRKNGKNLIVRLSIAGIDYIDKDIAIRDFVGLERTTRWVWIGILFVTIVLFVLICKGVIR